MTTPREPDPIVSAWLEEGPTELPEPTRRAIAVATRTTHQTRRAFRAPWRINPMNPMPRLALLAIAVVAVAGGALVFLWPGDESAGGPGPTTSPSEAPTASPPASEAPSPSQLESPWPSPAWESFTSDRFGYEIQVPGGWTHGAPVDDLPDELFPGTEGDYADRWDAPIMRVPWVLVAVRDPEPEESVQAWIARNLSLFAEGCDTTEPIDVVVGGEPAARLSATCMPGVATDVVLFSHAGRAYSIEASGATRDAASTSAILDRVLGSFTFTD